MEGSLDCQWRHWDWWNQGHSWSEKDMEIKEEENFLGDVILYDGRNIKNVKSRVAKGTGINRRILTILVWSWVDTEEYLASQ